MNQLIPTKFSIITFAIYIPIVTVIILLTNPMLVRANELSANQCSTQGNEWQSSVRNSMACLQKAMTGDNSSSENKTAVLSNEELQMISLINQERAEAGLQELEVDNSLVKLAQAKSLDMVTYNYFGHISERFGSIYDQLSKTEIPYRIVAENLAGNCNYRKAEQYFLESPAHRNNILNPHFKKVGVGIVHGGPYGAMITQIFLG